MKILFIARTYPPLVGGMEKFASDFYTNLKQKANLKLIANPIGKKRIIHFFFRVMFFLVFNARKFDIIHFNDAILSPLIPVIWLFSSAKITFTVHGLDVVYRKFGYQTLVIPCLRKADRIFPVSQFTKKQCLVRKIPDEKLHVIPNGLDFSRVKGCAKEQQRSLIRQYNIDIEKTKLLSLGRLIRRKGHVWFLENVFIKLPDSYLYLIAGNGPESSHISETIKSLNLEDRVILFGYVSETEKACLFQIADLFIMPNIQDQHDQEGFGIVLLEAGSHALPSIASNIEGITDAIIDGVTGVLVEEKHAQGFIEAITNYKFQPADIREKLTARYDWNNISQIYYDEFTALIKNA